MLSWRPLILYIPKSLSWTGCVVSCVWFMWWYTVIQRYCNWAVSNPIYVLGWLYKQSCFGLTLHGECSIPQYFAGVLHPAILVGIPCIINIIATSYLLSPWIAITLKSWNFYLFAAPQPCLLTSDEREAGAVASTQTLDEGKGSAQCFAQTTCHLVDREVAGLCGAHSHFRNFFKECRSIVHTCNDDICVICSNDYTFRSLLKEAVDGL